MRYARSWERRLEHLAQVGEVAEIEPGRIRVTVAVAKVPGTGQASLVHDGGYDVRASPTPELPEDPDEARRRELMEQHPGGIPGGRWGPHRHD